MKICTYLGKKIELPKHLLNFYGEDQKANLNTHTPYLDEFLYKNRKGFTFFYGEWSTRHYSVSNLYKKMKGKYSSYFELLGGLGISTSFFSDGIEKNTIINDLDDGCLEVVKHNIPEATFFKEDMYNFPFEKIEFDVVLADYNNNTLHKFIDTKNNKYNKISTELFSNAKKYFIMNDCTVFHLNVGGKKAYDNVSKALGITVTNREEFFRGMKSFYESRFPDWCLTDIEHFRTGAYFLFSKVERKDLEIHYNDTEEVRKLKPFWIELDPGDEQRK